MRHKICNKKLLVKDDIIQRELDAIELLQSEEKWILAGERFFEIANKLKKGNKKSLDAVVLFAKSAACFESACQYKDAAVAYDAAGGVAHHNIEVDRQILGELYGLAASCYTKSQQFFFAGTALRRAATAFENADKNVISIEDAIPPLPMAAGKYTMSGRCLDASSEAFEKARDNAWASGSSWLAGKVQLKEKLHHTSISTCESFRKAFVLCVRFYKTLKPEKIRNALPLTDEERSEEINPINFVIEIIEKHYKGGYEMNPHFPADWVDQEVFRYVSAMYQELHIELKAVGNNKEANEYYVKLKKLEKEYAWKQKSYFDWFSKYIWEITCNYGENMHRWITVSFIIFLFFTGLYATLDLIEPVKSWIDYPYFSIITLTIFGFGDIYPKNSLGKVVVCAEIIFGLLMFGMLVTFFSKRLIKD